MRVCVGGADDRREARARRGRRGAAKEGGRGFTEDAAACCYTALPVPAGTASPTPSEADVLGRMRNLGYNEVLSAVTPRDAVEALREVLKGGFDPASDPHRQKVALPHGEMHLLPSALDGAVGVKVLGIQPAGSDVDVPLVQGSYLLMGGETLTPEVVMDAAALTEVRTPAVAVAGGTGPVAGVE